MCYRQKLGYMVLGAGIVAVGIIIGQIITPDIEAQNNGVFDKITCRELEVVDKDGEKAIVLHSDEDENSVIIYKPLKKRANFVNASVVGLELASTGWKNEIRISDQESNGSGIWLFSSRLLGSNRVVVYRLGKKGRQVELYGIDTASGVKINKGNIHLESSDTQNIISVRDVKEVSKDAFVVFSNDGGNSASRWIRGRGRKANW